jgi:transposase
VFDLVTLLLLSITTRSDAWLEYLPPYSSDYTPIEECFLYIKHYMCRHKARHFDNDEDLLALCEEAILEITEEDVEGWSWDCGYA